MKVMNRRNILTVFWAYLGTAQDHEFQGWAAVREVTENLVEDGEKELKEAIKLRKEACKAGYFQVKQEKDRTWQMKIVEGKMEEIQSWLDNPELLDQEDSVIKLPQSSGGVGFILTKRVDLMMFRKIGRAAKDRGWTGLAWFDPDYEVFVRRKGTKEKPVRLLEIGPDHE